jgi:hypothetical protein
LRNLIESNPLLKQPILAVLKVSEHSLEWLRDDLEAVAAVELKSCTAKQTPATIVDIVVRNGG